MFEIDFYENESGYSEVSEYLNMLDDDSQDKDKRALKKIRYQLDLLENLGVKLHVPQFRYLKEYEYPLIELKPLPEIIIYMSWLENKFVVLNYYIKKNEAFNPREIVKALDMLKDWIQRKCKGTITWSQKKKEMKSISEYEILGIDSLAYLHSIRIKKGISQVNLAEKIGKKQPQVAMIENLKFVPTLETLTKYAEGLNLTTKLVFKPNT